MGHGYLAAFTALLAGFYSFMGKFGQAATVENLASR